MRFGLILIHGSPPQFEGGRHINILPVFVYITVTQATVYAYCLNNRPTQKHTKITNIFLHYCKSDTQNIKQIAEFNDQNIELNLNCSHFYVMYCIQVFSEKYQPVTVMFTHLKRNVQAIGRFSMNC